jgi:hypothetical protein
VLSFLLLQHRSTPAIRMALQALANKELNLKFTSDSDLQVLMQQGKFSSSEIQEYQHLPDVHKIFQNLTSVGDLLGLAMVRAGDHDCAKTILLVQCKYKTMIGDSLMVSTVFVSTCLQACKSVQLAYKLALRGRYDLMGKQLLACAGAAGNMAKHVEPLIILAQELVDTTDKALQDTCENKSTSAKEREKIRTMISQTRVEMEKHRVEADERASFIQARHEKMMEEQAKVDATQKEISEASKQMQKISAEYAQWLSSSDDEFSQKLAEAKDKDREEWLKEKNAAEAKRQAHLEAAEKLKKEEKEAFEKAVKDAEEEYKESKKAYDTQMEDRRAKSSLANQEWASANGKHSALQTTLNHLESEERRLRKEVGAAQELLGEANRNLSLAANNTINKMEKQGGIIGATGGFIGMFSDKPDEQQAEGERSERGETLKELQKQLQETQKESKKVRNDLVEEKGKMDIAASVLESDKAVVAPEKPKLREIVKEDTKEPGMLDKALSFMTKDKFQIPCEPVPGRQEKMILEERARKVENFSRAMEERKKGVQASMKSQERTLDGQRQQLMKEKQDQARNEETLADVKGQIAGALEAIKSGDCKKDSLEQAIQGLELAMQNLGRITLAFKQVKQFWASVQQHCQRIAEECSGTDIEAVVALEDDDEINGKLETLLKNWAILGQKNVAARNAISVANSNVDDFFEHIPGGAEREEYIKNQVSKLEKTLMIPMEEEAARIRSVMEEPE